MCVCVCVCVCLCKGVDISSIIEHNKLNTKYYTANADMNISLNKSPGVY